jgi:hypothetical protein
MARWQRQNGFHLISGVLNLNKMSRRIVREKQKIAKMNGKRKRQIVDARRSTPEHRS